MTNKTEAAINFSFEKTMNKGWDILTMETNKRKAWLDNRFKQTACLPHLDNPSYIRAREFNQKIPNDILTALELEVLYEIACKAELQPRDVIYGIPMAGLAFGGLIARAYGLSLYNVARKGESIPGDWEKDEIMTVKTHSYTTGSESVLKFGYVKPGMRVVLVDDVIASGKTLIDCINAFEEKQVKTAAVVCMFCKLFEGGVEKIKKMGIPVISAVKIDRVENGEIILKPREKIEENTDSLLKKLRSLNQA